MTSTQKQDWRGAALILASAGAFSTAGFFTRLITVDSWTVLFWRGIFGGAFIAAFVVASGRGAAAWTALRERWGITALVAACSALATVCFINALRRSTVADVTVIYATAPFLTAAIGWLWLGTRESRVTLVASVVALLGVVVMFGAAASDGHLFGDLLALVMTGLMSMFMVLVRRHRDVPMLPAAAASAFASAVLVSPVAAPLAPGGLEFLWLALFGITQFGLGLLLTLGSRLISPTRTALIGNLEIPLAPAMVWLAFGEVPALVSCAGGLLVLGAVVGDLWLRPAEGEQG